MEYKKTRICTMCGEPCSGKTCRACYTGKGVRQNIGRLSRYYARRDRAARR